MKRALIAMSGGVDSSLAAKLMVDSGAECIGCTMKLYQNEDIGVSRSRTCCSLDDVEDARSVACHLGMHFYVFNFTEAFRDTVLRGFVESYQKGITPTGADTVHIVFDEPQRAIAPGQAAVLYDGDTVLGGGTLQPEA